MCKIFTLTNTSKITNLSKAINVINKALVKYEDDGFGYAISGASGVFGERTVFPKHFKTSFSREILSLPFSTVYYNRFGKNSSPSGAGIFHGRTSTNDQTLLNTHPISNNGWHLIHNGVVSNHGPKYEMKTTNDTEHVLHHLMSSDGIRGIEKHLTGYYAVSAIDSKGKLHIVKDNVASLFVARIKTIDSLVFATTQSLIETICDEMEWEVSVINLVDDNCYLIFDGNILKHHETIKPKGRTAFENKFADLSLGKSLFPENNSNELFTDDELEFLNEVKNYADHSYKFLDYHQNPLTLEEFSKLEDNEKLYCTVIRPDGTLVDSNDYYSDKLYSGAI